ncbi:MAG TPA: HNH endonuclease [Puia sp.]
MAYKKRYRSYSGYKAMRKNRDGRAIFVFFIASFFGYNLLAGKGLPQLGQVSVTANHIFEQLRPLLLFVALCISFVAVALIIKYIINSDYISNKSGYLFHPLSGYQHRRRAQKGVGSIKGKEVHHINGNPSDNVSSNLCVIKKDKHAKYHTWLRREKARLGHYPSDERQRKKLRSLGGRIG